MVSADAFLSGKRPAFKTRQAALEEAVQLLNGAAVMMQTVTPSAFFNVKVGTDIDMKNAVNALLSRYNLMLGKYAEALAAANNVDLAKKSFFRYDAVSQNPVFRTSLVTNNTYNGLPNFGLPDTLKPNALDARIAFKSAGIFQKRRRPDSDLPAR